MLRRAQQIIRILIAVGCLLPGAGGVRAADPEIDQLLRSSVDKDWVTNGGNLTNQRYSVLKQIDTTNAKTGEILWERWSGIDQKLTSVCCGWDSRGLAIGEGTVFVGQLDANVVALDSKTGKEVWKTAIEDWHDGYGITSAPLYYNGIVYSGITGGEFGVRGRLTALDAKTGKILW